MGTDELPWCGSHVKFFGFFLRTPSGGIFSVSVWMKSTSLIQPYHPSEQGHTSMFCAPTPLLASPIHQCHCYSWRLCLLFPPDCKICKYWITVVAYRYMTRHTVAQWLRTPAHRFPEFWFTSSFAGFQRPCPYGFSQTESRLNCIALRVPRLFTWDSMTCHWSFASCSKLDWHPAQCPRKQSQRSKASVETGCRTHTPCLRISESYGTIRLNDVHSGMRGAVE